MGIVAVFSTYFDVFHDELIISYNDYKHINIDIYTAYLYLTVVVELGEVQHMLINFEHRLQWHKQNPSLYAIT